MNLFKMTRLVAFVALVALFLFGSRACLQHVRAGQEEDSRSRVSQQVVPVIKAQFTGLGLLGESRTEATAVSSDGRVVVGDGSGSTSEAFRWTEEEGMTGLGDLPGGQLYSLAAAVSRDGSVIVGESHTDGGPAVFRWTSAEGMQKLEPQNSEFRRLTCASYGLRHVNIRCGVAKNGDVVVGSAFIVNREWYEAYRWIRGQGAMRLGDLSGPQRTDSFEDPLSVAYAVSRDGNVVVGFSESPQGKQAFRWTPASGMRGLGTLGGDESWSEAIGVSSGGEYVVGFSSSGERTEAFRWEASGGMTGLGDIAGGHFHSVATGVSSDGKVVVGWGSLPPFTTAAFIWTEERGLEDLREVLLQHGASAELKSWRLYHAAAISDDGTIIVGAGFNPSGQGEAWRAILPRDRVKVNP